MQKNILYKTVSTGSIVDKGTMTDLVKKIPNIVQTSEKGTNVDPIKLPQTSKVEDISNKQDPKEMWVPYRHPNHKSRYDQQQGQEESKQCSSYQQLNYNIEKERRQNRQLLWKPKIRNPIQKINHQTIPMKVDLGWITSRKM